MTPGHDAKNMNLSAVHLYWTFTFSSMIHGLPLCKLHLKYSFWKKLMLNQPHCFIRNTWRGERLDKLHKDPITFYFFTELCRVAHHSQVLNEVYHFTKIFVHRLVDLMTHWCMNLWQFQFDFVKNGQVDSLFLVCFCCQYIPDLQLSCTEIMWLTIEDTVFHLLPWKAHSASHPFVWIWALVHLCSHCFRQQWNQQ